MTFHLLVKTRTGMKFVNIAFVYFSRNKSDSMKINSIRISLNEHTHTSKPLLSLQLHTPIPQLFFFTEWGKLKEYARKKNIWKVYHCSIVSTNWIAAEWWWLVAISHFLIELHIKQKWIFQIKCDIIHFIITAQINTVTVKCDENQN